MPILLALTPPQQKQCKRKGVLCWLRYGEEIVVNQWNGLRLVHKYRLFSLPVTGVEKMQNKQRVMAM
jgi:hypothetical protein